MNKKKTIVSFLLVFCMLVSLIPVMPFNTFSVKGSAAENGSITVGITAVNGDTNQSGSYIITEGTFSATYWYVIAATKAGSGFKVTAVYDEGAKSVSVPEEGILVAVHTGLDAVSAARNIKAGYHFTTSNGIDINKGTVASGSYITASVGDLTPATVSNIKLDTTGKLIYGISLGTTVQNLKSQFTQANASLAITNKAGSAVSSGVVGTGFILTVSTGTKYTISVKGDINGDGRTTVTDYLMIRRGIAGTYSFNEAQKKAADINADGTPDANDYLNVKTFFKGKTSPMDDNKTTEIKDKKDPIEYETNKLPQTKYNSRSVTYWMSQLKGTHDGTVLTGNYLTLASGRTSGTFITNEMNVGQFTRMLISWNSTTTSGSVEVSAAYQTSSGTWSGYYSFGLWKGKTGYSYSRSDTYAQMDQDTFIPKYTASGLIKVKIVLKKTNAAPVLRNITIAAGAKVLRPVGAYPAEFYNPVIVRRQDAPENGSIGPVICSATTTAMMLSWYGINQTTLTVAAGVLDTAANAYGDWLFNMAYAGEMGMTAYCDFYDIEMTKYVLSTGNPVGCSIKGTLPGSRYGTTSGHLVLAVGYKTIGGVKYLLVNDPYCYDSHVTNNTPYNYKETDFANVWLRWPDANGQKFGAAYVFEDLDI